MQALNHVAIGTLIAVTVKEPALVVPISLASHFGLDMLPHYGEDRRAPRGSGFYHARIVVDAIISLAFIAAACLYFPSLSGVILLGAFFAFLPDLFWPVALYIKKSNPFYKFFTFHKGIQKFESPKGAYVEVVWFTAVVTILVVLHS